MKTVYFLSGLGANKRAFSMLDLSFCKPVFIDWLPPLKNETLPQYAGRLRSQINEPEPVIIGLSFGGMLAIEMAKVDPGIRAILIASTKTSKEFPSYLRVGKYFPIYKWLPNTMLKRSAYIYKKFLGINGPEQLAVFRKILDDTDMGFTKWAISAILNWKNEEVPEGLVHIHGTADRLLPFRLVKADHIIQGGTHVLPMDNHQEISLLLKELVCSR